MKRRSWGGAINRAEAGCYLTGSEFEGRADVDRLTVAALVGQGRDTILIDAVDENMAAKIAELRLFKATETDAMVYGGTLRIPGYGAWAVSCTGP